MYLIALYHRGITDLISVYFFPHGGYYVWDMTQCGLVVHIPEVGSLHGEVHSQQ